MIGLTFQSDNISEAYQVFLRNCLERGEFRNPRGFETKEIMAVRFILTNPRNSRVMIPARKLNPAFAVGEFIWYLLGKNDLKFIKYYNKNMAKFSDDGKILYGAYGPHIEKQFNYIIETLTNDKFSRQAIMTIWIQNPEKSKDIPCTISFQFMTRYDYFKKSYVLDMYVYMRSNDLILGFPYDVSTFTLIQQIIASILDYPLGYYVHNVGSLHLYKSDFEWAKKIIVDDCLYGSWPKQNKHIKLYEIRSLLHNLEIHIRYRCNDIDKILNHYGFSGNILILEFIKILTNWRRKKDARNNI